MVRGFAKNVDVIFAGGGLLPAQPKGKTIVVMNTLDLLDSSLNRHAYRRLENAGRFGDSADGQENGNRNFDGRQS